MHSVLASLLLLLCCQAFALLDNVYEITVYTGKETWAGTNAGVYIKLFGDYGTSNLQRLPKDTKYFEKGRIDKFDVTFEQNVGDINTIQIGHDGAGMYADWKLEEVRIRRYNSLKTSRFVVKRWLKQEFKKSTRHVEVTREDKEQCGRSPARPRVIMGDTSSKGQWPWQVQIRKDGYPHYCGGTLVHPQWVVTAGHCFYRDPDVKKYTLMLGEHNRNEYERTEQTFRIIKLIIHPNYNSHTKLNNDVTLIKLDRPALMDQQVQLACLPDAGFQLPAGEDCFVSGWGQTFNGGDAPAVLQHARMPSVTNQECYSQMKSVGKVTEMMVCGGGNNKGGCHGDSGGPYVCLNMHGQFVLQGVVSWGNPNCNAVQYYTVFARVGKFVEWIETNIYSKYITDY